MRKAVLFAIIAVSVAIAQDGARYLVICRDELQTSIQPLADWKRATGLETKVVPLSQVGYDTTSIKNYVRTAYNTWPIKPEYVLLVGSPSLLTSRVYTLQHGGSYSSDNIYGDMTSDVRMELPVGRFPAKSTAQLDVMVAKALAYEKNPEITDSLWIRRLTTVVQDRNDDDWPTYWADIRYAAQLAGQAGYVSCESLSTLRGDSWPDIVTSVNQGTGLVLYRGTAGGNWYQPFNINPAQTANGRELPIILSTTCETMTLTPNESMVGEAWLKTGTTSNPKGAVAFFGNTHSASDVAALRSAVARGFFTGLFTENKYKLGHAMIRAKDQLYSQFPTYTSDYRGFNLLGDPELAIWTATPKPLSVQHPAEILKAQQQVEVLVTAGGNPVSGAKVCASMGTAVYKYGNTDGQGRVLLDVNPSDTGRMRLVVTGQNLYPYDGTIHVVTEVGVAEGRLPAPVACNLTVQPTQFTVQTVIRLSRPLADGERVIIHDAAGRAVRTAAGIGTTQFSWNGVDGENREMGTGVYFCSLADGFGRTLSSTKLVKLD
jgi:hypothetical protein